MKLDKIPEATITRLSLYSRYLSKMEAFNIEKVSSVDIANGVQGTPAQVRKDLAYFGDFGMRGVGYNVKGLNNIIKEILGLDHEWQMILIMRDLRSVDLRFLPYLIMMSIKSV